ncbi:uncharacterized protein PGTG_06855 [Puccinia graminis f. sp. tritici CRL 75-36-700-3]|uniref:Nudix hydrolase domain-containing protein n=1 Tax=Puccinia graminis f. sp. tritici (strain CRL 75-36-700-3 / race SCCL) TaxID=418459 RepID=E3KA72_PUCGT|nr:uncharacterized protein PGTG_06855 [Puccinia graminis f. sp. tritici CRL 75-36-700-3]EFP81234.1 hypothetical protein PGTG_06855 [Puccinia graminis f. sp. tritici CRL 75-36-700-3]
MIRLRNELSSASRVPRAGLIHRRAVHLGCAAGQSHQLGGVHGLLTSPPVSQHPNKQAQIEMAHQPNIINGLLQIKHSSPTTISTTTTATTATTPLQKNCTTKRASVAIIIRIAPDSQSTPSSPTNYSTPESSSSPTSDFQRSSLKPHNLKNHSDELNQQLQQFFSQPWVQNGTAELFYIERATRPNDRWSAHMAFPGGRMEPEDEDGLFCAMRETWEEVGIDLAEKEFIQLGRLDDREITTSLGKRLLMVLSPYVFLSTHHPNRAPIPTLEPAEVTAAYWVPFHSLAGPQTRWGEMTIDLSSRLAPSRGPLIKFFLRSLVGSMRFRSILLPHNPITELTRTSSPPPPPPPSSSKQQQQEEDHQPRPDLNLWGLTLGMTLDLLSFFKTSDPSLPDQPNLFKSPSLEHLNVPPREITLVAPSITSIFPRFTHPDINALIWLLGRRYRNLIKRCQDQQQHQQMQMINIGKQRMEEDGSEEEEGLEGGRKAEDEEEKKQQQRRRKKHKKGSSSQGGQKMTINYMNNEISWTSLAMKEFYRSVRKALILSVLFRILSVAASLATISCIWGPAAIASSRRLLHKLYARLALRFFPRHQLDNLLANLPLLWRRKASS